MKKAKRPPQTVRRDEGPEDALWRNVITQAIEDATLRISERCKAAIRAQREHMRDQARNWVERQGEDFRLVCELAGLESSRVHQFAMTKIRESIERDSARTAELLTSAMPGVVPNFLQRPPDRPTSDAREAAEIGFSQNEVLPS